MDSFAVFVRQLRLFAALSLCCSLSATLLACDNSDGADETGGDDGGNGDDGDNLPSCPAEQTLATEDFTPYFVCGETEPCPLIYQEIKLDTVNYEFVADISGSEAAAQCWFTELAAGTPGVYALNSKFFDEDVSRIRWRVYNGRVIERTLAEDLEGGGVEVSRGPRGLLGQQYWSDCASTYDGGPYLPTCFYDGVVDCTTWVDEMTACGG